MNTTTRKHCIGIACAVVIAGAGLAGCETVHQANLAVDKATDAIQATTKRAESEKTPTVSRTQGAWLMGQTVVVSKPDSPVLLQKIQYANPRASLGDIAAYLSQHFDLPVDVSDVTGNNGLMTGGTSAAASGTAPVGAGPSAALPMPPAFLANAAANAQSFARVPDMRLSYEGTVKGLLDVVAEKAGIWWRFEDGRVEFFRSMTKTVYMPALARRSSVKSTIVASGGPSNGVTTGQPGSTTGSANADSGNTGSSNIASSYDIDIWKSIETTAKTVAGGSGPGAAIITASESLGGITVTGTPTQVRRVEEWARNLSDNLSQMVKVSVTLYTVTLNNEDNYSWSPDVVFNKLGSAYGFNLSGPTVPAASNALTPFKMSAKVLESSTNALRGSELVYTALSTLGKVSSVKTWSAVALNGQVANVQMASQTTYAAQAGTTATANVGTSTTLTPGTVTTGLTGTIQPRIVNGKITLAMDLTDSAVVGITPFTSGGVTIQLPKITTTALPSSVSLTPGSSLLATAVRQNTGSVSKNGTFVPENPLLGGGTGATTGQQLVVVDISAEVM